MKAATSPRPAGGFRYTRFDLSDHGDFPRQARPAAPPTALPGDDGESHSFAQGGATHSAGGGKPPAGRKPRREVGYRFRHPEVDDGTAIWELVRDTGVLDINSAYSYIMLGEYFSETCLIAEHKGRMVGFVSGFIPKQKPDTLFIWQIAIAGTERGRGLARTLLLKILDQPSCADLHYIECTVTPSNQPSTRLFRSVAKELGTECRIEDGFEGELFPEDGHEGERLFRIGPFNT